MFWAGFVVGVLAGAAALVLVAVVLIVKHGEGMLG